MFYKKLDEFLIISDSKFQISRWQNLILNFEFLIQIGPLSIFIKNDSKTHLQGYRFLFSSESNTYLL